ncbi:MAG: clostripain-related cysteine peptidase [Caldilineaceae bacterium]
MQGPTEYDNFAASLRIPVGKSVIVYTDRDGQGERSGCLTGEPNLPDVFYHTVSSIHLFADTICTLAGSPTETPIPTPPSATPQPTITPSVTPTTTVSALPTAILTPAPTPRCYLLTLRRQGEGSAPAPTPTQSEGCPAGHYAAGESIVVQAAPAEGWFVAGWQGVEGGDSAAQITLTMPTQPTTVTVIYAQPDPESWTILIYAVADNNLERYMGLKSPGMLSRLHQADAQPNVQVGIWYDGRDSGDSTQYTLNALGQWSGPRDLGEREMDDPQTLTAFLRWGYAELPATHYYLAILDHANGVLGVGEDLTSDVSGLAYLTPEELRQAVEAGKQGNPLDIVQIDGCSFGLLEDASIFDGLADYMIASPNTGWGVFAYDAYRQLVGQAPNPPSVVAERVAAEYARQVADYGVPYTISVFDLANYAPLHQALDKLGNALVSYLQVDQVVRTQALREIRNQVQLYDAGDYLITPNDSYVDLPGLAAALQDHPDSAVAAAAAEVLNASAPFVLSTHHSSAPVPFYSVDRAETITVDVSRSRGLAIYYPYSSRVEPGAYTRYVDDQLFYWATVDWGWRAFLDQSLPAQLPSDPIPDEDRLISMPGVEPRAWRLYLPVVQE